MNMNINMGMDQYLLIPFLGGWTSIYQLFWCSQGYKVLTHCHIYIYIYTHVDRWIERPRDREMRVYRFMVYALQHIAIWKPVDTICYGFPSLRYLYIYTWVCLSIGLTWIHSLYSFPSSSSFSLFNYSHKLGDTSFSDTFRRLAAPCGAHCAGPFLSWEMIFLYFFWEGTTSNWQWVKTVYPWWTSK